MSTTARLVIVKIEGNTLTVTAVGRFDTTTVTWDPAADAARLMLDIVSYELSVGGKVEYQIVGEVDRLDLQELTTHLGTRAQQFIYRDAPQGDSRAAA